MKTFTKLDPDRDRRVAIELADSYRQMMQMAAWKDLNEVFDRIVSNSNADVDHVAIEQLCTALVARARGLREAIEMIRKHIGYRTSEGPK